MQRGQQRQQQQAQMRLGYEGEEKPGTKLCRALETRWESSAKYAQDLEGKFSVFESKGVCGAVLPRMEVFVGEGETRMVHR